ncbi:hypothetical protein [Azorhizobium caulinodans]|uniref:hypothetical protein n=1 Tax=Azorhizobium caulinodans TaxID=7 RepID=UPI002FBEEF41
MVDSVRMTLEATAADGGLRLAAFHDGCLLVPDKVVTRHGLRAGDRRNEQRDRDQKGQQRSHPSHRLQPDAHA